MMPYSTPLVRIAAAMLLSLVLNRAVSPSPLRYELVFVDAGVEAHDQLLAELRGQGESHRHLQVYVLDAQRDGIEQISEVLAGYRELDAVHLVAHGTAGATQLGNTTLRVDTLSRYAHALASWQDALARKADLLFYSCQLAGSEPGQGFGARIV